MKYRSEIIKLLLLFLVVCSGCAKNTPNITYAEVSGEIREDKIGTIAENKIEEKRRTSNNTAIDSTTNSNIDQYSISSRYNIETEEKEEVVSQETTVNLSADNDDLNALLKVSDIIANSIKLGVDSTEQEFIRIKTNDNAYNLIYGLINQFAVDEHEGVDLDESYRNNIDITDILKYEIDVINGSNRDLVEEERNLRYENGVNDEGVEFISCYEGSELVFLETYDDDFIHRTYYINGEIYLMYRYNINDIIEKIVDDIEYATEEFRFFDDENEIIETLTRDEAETKFERLLDEIGVDKYDISRSDNIPILTIDDLDLDEGIYKENDRYYIDRKDVYFNFGEGYFKINGKYIKIYEIDYPESVEDIRHNNLYNFKLDSYNYYDNGIFIAVYCTEDEYMNDSNSTKEKTLKITMTYINDKIVSFDYIFK